MPPTETAVGSASLTIAKPPATCAADCDVPENSANPLFGTEDTMFSPGAKRSTRPLEFENPETVSVSLVEPTVTAVEMHPGAATALLKPPFPDGTTVAIRAERRLSIASLRASASQSFAD